MARRRGDKHTERKKKTEALEHADDMPKWWSPRALALAGHSNRPNLFWWKDPATLSPKEATTRSRGKEEKNRRLQTS